MSNNNEVIKHASENNAIYVCELNNATQANIRKAIIDRLKAEGLSGEAEIQEYTNDAMSSKIDSLEDTINIKQIILDSDGQVNNLIKRRYEASKKQNTQSKKNVEELER